VCSFLYCIIFYIFIQVFYTRDMKIIIGLGNPEARYTGTRHNVGFAVLDHFASTHRAIWKQSTKFKASTAELSIAGEKITLVKPTTFYNLVGESARAIMDFYKLTLADVLIVHDDLALPLGTIRTRVGGSDGGNNGLKSLALHIGTETARLRVGVWTDAHHATDKVSVVLGKISKDEQATLDAQLPKAAKIIEQFATGDFESTTHRAST